MSSLSSFFSAVFSTVHNDSEEKPETEVKNDVEEAKEEEPAVEEEQAEEEEEEPEDTHPAIKEECQNSTKCAQLARHFEHCNEKVNSGQGFKGEDCVEELCM
ncbi:Cytochrome b-c1 complex subunit 6, mitochondrial [Marasmius crinis-equi]|uniref:Cytochrome b-c1 complex subunit 6, mitochondrial n=1 Tax=Marasmius crinis-equi TaxID=585013 RepID=A0ABR3FMF0_9AGAR